MCVAKCPGGVIPTELLTVLGGRVGQLVEDYDASKCRVLYSDSNLIATSPRPEAVSELF